MQHAKKYALVAEDQLLKHTPTQQHMTDFDRQMSKILNSKLSDYEKVQQYYDLLKRKLNLQDYNLPRMPSEEQPKEEPAKSNEDYTPIILNSVPVSFKKQASTLLDILKANSNILNWNEQGEVIYKNQKYNNSNLADLFNWMFTNRKTANMIAKQEFLNALQELNVPKHYIKNKQLLTTPVKQEMVSLDNKRKQNVKKLNLKAKSRVLKWVSFK